MTTNHSEKSCGDAAKYQDNRDLFSSCQSGGIDPSSVGFPWVICDRHTSQPDAQMHTLAVTNPVNHQNSG